jgi:hypothetical protein
MSRALVELPMLRLRGTACVSAFILANDSAIVEVRDFLITVTPIRSGRSVTAALPGLVSSRGSGTIRVRKQEAEATR